MDMGMVCSAEMLVLGDEIVGMARRFMRGIEVNPETLARDVIAQVGPGGHYLEEDHTFNHFREQLWNPSLLTRPGRDEWQAAGSKDMAQKVHERVREIVNSHQAPPLPDAVVAALASLREKGAAEVAK
jgi:trimethylamine--corrinoid protein Co-methyltransferase